MRKSRIVIVIVVAVVIVVAGIALFMRNQLDGIVASAIETQGSRLTGTSVSVGRVTMKLRHGSVTIHDLRVANPDGFSGQDALALGTLVLDLDTGTLRKEPHVVQELTVDDATVRYEIAKDGRRNLDIIRDRLDEAKPTSQPDQPSPPLIVRSLRFTGGEVTADASALGVEVRSQDLPAFTLTDLGAPDGAPSAEIGKQVLERLIQKAAGMALDSELEGRLGALLKNAPGQNVSDAAKSKLEGLLHKSD